MAQVRDLETVVQYGLCAGCGLCESLAGRDRVRMTISPASQIRPVIREPLDRDTLDKVLALCPGVNLHGHGVEAAGPDGRMHLIWGPYVSLAKGYASDPDIRFKAAAGGVLTALSVYLVESGKVDCIVHVAASKQAPMHTDSQTSFDRAQVIEGAQSRYGPAAPLDNVIRLLDEGKRFAVVGKPCDVAAMRNLARIDPRVERQVPYLMTIFCGGVPTLATSQKIAANFGLEEDDLDVFRYRGEGWPGMTHLRAKDGRSFELTYDQVWYEKRPWTYDIQFRCKICPDAIGELADVTCPDCWKMVDGEPVHDEGDGWDVIIGRTAKGAALVDEAVAAGYVTREPYAVEEFDTQHAEHAWRKQANFARILGLAATGQPRPRFRNLRRFRTALSAGFRANWHGFSGMLRGVREGRNREPAA